jgi:hypothetical protein
MQFLLHKASRLTSSCRIGDIVQKWRDTLDLEPLPLSEAPFLMETLQIPFTYCWSPALVPKPRDWGRHIGVYVFSLSRSRLIGEQMYVVSCFEIHHITIRHQSLKRSWKLGHRPSILVSAALLLMTRTGWLLPCLTPSRNVDYAL